MIHLKFRAWDKKRKRMYKAIRLNLDSVDGVWAIVKGRSIIEDKAIHLQIQPKDIVLMQFTGLADRFGKEIYEGDIFGLSDKKDKSKCVVVFKDGAFMRSYIPFQSAKEKKRKDYYEMDFIHHITIPRDLILWHVIGNIYENPDIK